MCHLYPNKKETEFVNKTFPEKKNIDSLVNSTQHLKKK